MKIRKSNNHRIPGVSVPHLSSSTWDTGRISQYLHAPSDGIAERFVRRRLCGRVFFARARAYSSPRSPWPLATSWLDLVRRSAARDRPTLTLFLNWPLGRRRTYCFDLPVSMSWRREVFSPRTEVLGLVFVRELPFFIDIE